MVNALESDLEFETLKFIGNNGCFINASKSDVVLDACQVYNNLNLGINDLIDINEGSLCIDCSNIYDNDTTNMSGVALSAIDCTLISIKNLSNIYNNTAGNESKANFKFSPDTTMNIYSTFTGEIYFNVDEAIVLDFQEFDGDIKSDYPEFVCYKKNDGKTYYEEAITVDEQPSLSNGYEFIIDVSDYNNYVADLYKIKNISYQWYNANNYAPLSGQTSSKIGTLTQLTDAYCIVSYNINGTALSIQSDTIYNLETLEIVVPTKESIYVTACLGDKINLPLATNSIIASLTDSNIVKAGYITNFDFGSTFDFGEEFEFGKEYGGMIIDRMYLYVTHQDGAVIYDRILTGTEDYLTSGNYFMICDLTLTKTLAVEVMGDVNICMNGHILDLDGNYISVSGRLFLRDCCGIKDSTHSHIFKKSTDKLVKNNNGTYYYWGGTITNGSYNCANTSILVGSGGTLYLDNVNVVNNFGGVLCESANLHISNCKFEYNYGISTKAGTSSRCGGAVYVNASANDYEVNISNTTFKFNNALDGAAIFVEEGNVSLTDVTITKNTAQSGSGVFLSYGCKLILDGKVVINDNGTSTVKSDVFASNGNCFEIKNEFDTDSLIKVKMTAFDENISTQGNYYLESMDPSYKYVYLMSDFVVNEGVVVNIYLNDNILVLNDHIITVYGELNFYETNDASIIRYYKWNNGSIIETDSTKYDFSVYDGYINNGEFINYGTLSFNNLSIIEDVYIKNTVNENKDRTHLNITNCNCGYIYDEDGKPFIINEGSRVDIVDTIFNNITGKIASVIYTISKPDTIGNVNISDSKLTNCYGEFANYIYSDFTYVNIENSGIEFDDTVYGTSKSEIYLTNNAELTLNDVCFNSIQKVENIIYAEKSKVNAKFVTIESFNSYNNQYFIESHDSDININRLQSDREYPLILGYDSNVTAGKDLTKGSYFKVNGTLTFPDGVEDDNNYVIDTSLLNTNNLILVKNAPKGYKNNFVLDTNKFYIIEEENEGLYNTVLKIDAHKDEAHKEEYDIPLQSGGELEQLCYYLLEDTHIYEDIYIASGIKVKICLNGYNLILHDSKIINNGTLYITDCHKNISKTYNWSTKVDGLLEYDFYNMGSVEVKHAAICGCYEDAKNASSLLINTGECFLNNVSFVGGLSNNNGGAIDNYNSLYIEECIFSGNVAKKYGGAIYNNQNSNIDIIFASIDGNTAQYGGGIANKGEITVLYLNVVCNKADIGSAIYNEYIFTVLKNELTNGLNACNNSANDFATIYQTNDNSEFVIYNLNSIIAFNTSTNVGGGIYIDKGYAYLTASVYCNNGGLYVGVNSNVELNGVFAFINNEEYDIYIPTGALIDLSYVAKQSYATFTVQGCSSTMNPIAFTKETSAIIDYENITMRNSSYSIGSYIVENKHVFKAQVPFTITYNKNGGSGNYIDSNKYGNGMYITLYSGSAFTKENAKIVGWATSPSTQTIAYELNEEITIHNSIQLYAVWKEEVICDCTKTVYKKFDGISVDFLSGISGLSHLDNLVANYKLHDSDDSKYTTDLPINAGKYDVLITREEDDYTLSFSHVLENVIEITKKNIELFATEDDFTYNEENQSESLVAYFVDVDGNNKYLSVTSIVSNGKNANFINAGTYYVTYKLSDEDYVNYAMDANLVQIITYMYEIKKLVAVISSASIDGWTYGETPSTPSAVTSYGEVKYEYALEGSTEFTTTVPTQAGKYMMRPYVEENDNISCETLIISFTIGKVSFDLSEAEWSYVESITYDGLEHTVTLLNIPSEVTVEYTGNVATNAGTYTAHPTFTYDEDNYSVTPCDDLEWTINKYVYDMSDVAWNYSSAFTYDGEEHSVALNNIPEGLVYSYTDNKALYAGTYVAHVEFTYDNANYEVAEVSDLSWAINKYVYDMSNVAWDYTSAFTYDGEQHRVVINNIPEGLVYAYYNNNFTNAGTYVAHVEFIYDNVNYEVADIGELTWTINKIKVTVPTLKYTKEYTGQAINVDLNSDIYEAEQINVVDVGLYTFAINLKDTVNYEWINGGENKYASLEVTKSQVSISNFIVEDWTYGASDNEVEANTNFGEVVYTYSTSENGEYTNVAPTTPGTYYVKATVVGNDNYEGSSITRLFRIKKAKYVIDVSFDSITIPYDGTYHSLEIVGTLPEGVTVTYINNSAISAGVHNITVKFNGDYDNYEQIPDMEATITITKISYDMSNVSFVSKSYVYDGSLKQLTVMGTLPEGVNVRYYVNGKAFNGTLELGEYEITAFFTGDSANYNSINPMVARLTVLKGTYDLSNIQFKDAEYTYNGEEQTISINGELPNGLEVKYYIGENEFNGISEIGEYTVIAKFTGDFEHYYEVNSMEAKLIIKAKELKAENENSKLATLISDNGFASDLFVEVGAKQVEEAKETMIDYTDLNRYKVSMKDSEVVSHVYSVTVYRMVNGEKAEVPVSEIADGGEITIRLLVPSDIDPYYITGIIHAHSVDDVERIEFNVNDIDEYGYYEFNIDRLSEFAFIYNDIYYCKIHWMIVACLVLFVDFLLICWFVLRRQNLDLVTGMGFAAFAISLIVAFFLKNCETCNLILYICLGILILSFVLFTIKKEVKIKEDKNGIYLFDEE